MLATRDPCAAFRLLKVHGSLLFASTAFNSAPVASNTSHARARQKQFRVTEALHIDDLALFGGLSRSILSLAFGARPASTSQRAVCPNIDLACRGRQKCVAIAHNSVSGH